MALVCSVRVVVDCQGHNLTKGIVKILHSNFEAVSRPTQMPTSSGNCYSITARSDPKYNSTVELCIAQSKIPKAYMNSFINSQSNVIRVLPGSQETSSGRVHQCFVNCFGDPKVQSPYHFFPLVFCCDLGPNLSANQLRCHLFGVLEPISASKANLQGGDFLYTHKPFTGP
ncbi:hypothetical protein NC651_000353 [Populus alba x Populus x berolinensis]|nr:hypothetical protein NC651_000353 [Populus alba x Populus x berolinensis]